MDLRFCPIILGDGVVGVTTTIAID